MGIFFFLSKFSCLWGDQKKEKERAQALRQVRLFRETKEAFVRAERRAHRASPQRIQAVHTLASPAITSPDLIFRDAACIVSQIKAGNRERSPG